MYVLFGGPYTRAIINEAVLAEGGIDYELRPVDLRAGEHRSPEYLEINPTGMIPALITPGGSTLRETPAISLWLADHHGIADLAPPVEDADRGEFLSGLFYVTGEIEPAMKRWFYPHRYSVRTGDEDALVALAQSRLVELVAVIEQRLSGSGPFHLGARFSLVDLTLTYWLVYLDLAGALGPFPATRGCMELVLKRPKTRDLWARVALEAQAYTDIQARGEGVT